MDKVAYERVVGAVLSKKAGILDDAKNWASEHTPELVGAGVGAVGGGVAGNLIGGDATSTLLGALGGGALGYGGGSLYKSLAGAGGEEAVVADLAQNDPETLQAAAAIQEQNPGMSTMEAIGIATTTAAGGVAGYAGLRGAARNIRAAQLKGARGAHRSDVAALNKAIDYATRRRNLGNMTPQAQARLNAHINDTVDRGVESFGKLLKAKAGKGVAARAAALPSIKAILQKLAR